MREEEFTEAYPNQRMNEPELDEYFLHDRAVREVCEMSSPRANWTFIPFANISRPLLMPFIEPFHADNTDHMILQVGWV